MFWYIFLSILAYCVIGAVTGGYIHQVKSKEYNWGNDDSGFVGAGWPISLFWYLILKPLTRIGYVLGERRQAREERLKRIREQLEAVERERQLEVQKHIRELEAEEAEYQAQQQRASA